MKKEKELIEVGMQLTQAFKNQYKILDNCHDPQNHKSTFTSINGFSYTIMLDENHQVIEVKKE